MDQLQLDFREAMAHVPAPVTVITTTLGGMPTGTTVSAFASLSITPPMVVFALDNRGGMIERLRASGRAGINVLAGGQSEIALQFARHGTVDRFDNLAWHADSGLPRIDGARTWLRCEELTFIPGGDHTVVLGAVTESETSPGSSLAYHLRSFRDLTPPAEG